MKLFYVYITLGKISGEKGLLWQTSPTCLEGPWTFRQTPLTRYFSTRRRPIQAKDTLTLLWVFKVGPILEIQVVQKQSMK